MRAARREEFVWTPGDQAEYAKWRRGVFAFYGCAGLICLAAFWVHHFANDGSKPPVLAAAAKARTAPPGPRDSETSALTIYRTGVEYPSP
jgi:hypothetical protein